MNKRLGQNTEEKRNVSRISPIMSGEKDRSGLISTKKGSVGDLFSHFVIELIVWSPERL